MGHLRVLLADFNNKKIKDKVQVVRLIESSKRSQCLRWNGEIVPIEFPGTKKACLFKNGEIKYRSCKNDSDDDEVLHGARNIN